MPQATELGRGKTLWDAVFDRKTEDGAGATMDQFNRWLLSSYPDKGMAQLNRGSREREAGGIRYGDTVYGKDEWDAFLASLSAS